MTPNATQGPAGQNQNIPVFLNQDAFFKRIDPPVLPPVSDTRANLRTAMIDQIAGFQISLFQHLFPLTVNPDYQGNIMNDLATPDQVEAILRDVSNIKITVLSLNQITSTAANRLPANANVNVNIANNGLYAFLDNNPIIDACDAIAQEFVYGNRSVFQAQQDYQVLRNQIWTFYGF